MKECFKYEYGYVNIDDDCIYLTNSGNWSEVEKLKHHTSKKRNKNIKGYSAIILLPIIGAIFLFFIFNNLISNNISLFSIIGSVAILYFLYQYMSVEIGDRYKIPLEKIIEIEFIEENCFIVFHNLENETINSELKNISKKGKQLLINLNNDRVIKIL